MKEFRIGLVLLAILVFLCVLSVRTYAKEPDGIDRYLGMLRESIPEELSGSFDTDGEMRAPTLSEFFSECRAEFLTAVRRPVSMLSALLFALVLSAFFHGCRGLIRNDSVGALFDIVGNLCISLCVFSSASLSVEAARSFLHRVADFCVTLSPAVCAVCAASGNLTGATVTHAGLALCVSVCEKLTASCLLPLLMISLSLTVSSAVGGNSPDVSGFVKLLRGIFNTSLGLVSVLFSAVLAYQTWIGSAADSLASRTVRFTVGSSIPIVGASVGEAMRTVAGSLTFLKNTIGGVGVSVILLLLLPPLAGILTDRAAIGLCSAVARLTGSKREAGLLDELGAFYGSLCACVCLVSLMAILALALFAGTATAIGSVG